MSASATVDACDLGCPAAAPARARAHLQAGHLDHELARGVDPDSDPALALRARHLLRPGTRARIADSLEEVVRTASAAALGSAHRHAMRTTAGGLAAELLAITDCAVRARRARPGTAHRRCSSPGRRRDSAATTSALCPRELPERRWNAAGRSGRRSRSRSSPSPCLFWAIDLIDRI